MAIYIALFDVITIVIVHPYQEEKNLILVSFLALGLDMAIDLYMAMAMVMAKASSHLEIR